VRLDAIGFGSLNLDEFWEVSHQFLRDHALQPGREYVRDLDWFTRVYPRLQKEAVQKACDPGGSAANMIAALSKMGFYTGFYGAAGRIDAESLRLEELGLPENLRIAHAGMPTGRCLALIDVDDPHRDRALVILPNANDLAGSDELDRSYFLRARWIHLTSFVSSSPLRAQISLVKMLAPAVGLSFDPGAVYAARSVNELEPLLARTQILFVTEEEAEALTGELNQDAAVAKLFVMGMGTVVVKMGQRGLMAYDRKRAHYQPAIAPRQIRDRTGAGDVAAAGFLAGTMAGLTIPHCLELAAAAAARSIEAYGRGGYPDRDFFHSFASSRKGHDV
jgi:ribokinase